MDDDDDFFNDGPPSSKATTSSLLKNIVASSEVDSSRKSPTVASPVNHPNYYSNSGRYESMSIPRDYEDIRQVSSGSSSSPEMSSPVARKPPLPPTEAQRLAHSFNVPSNYDATREDRCKNPELRLDLSNLSAIKTKKGKKKKGSSKANIKSSSKLRKEEVADIINYDFPASKAKPKPNVHVPTGGNTKSNGKHHYYLEEDDDDSCSTCQSSSSSSVSDVCPDALSERSDVTSVSPLNSPHQSSQRALKNLYDLHASAHASVTATTMPKTKQGTPQADELFRMMRRLIDNVDKDQKISRGRGQPGWAAFANPDRASTAGGWAGSSESGGPVGRHPTLGEIIQSLSRLHLGGNTAKSVSSAAPSIASATGSGFSASTTFSHGSKSMRPKSAGEPLRRKHHAAINRDKKQREIAAENLRIYQRLQMIRASPEVTRERQIADWQRMVGTGSGGAGGGRVQSGYNERASYGVAPLSGLISSAGVGTKPIRPQSAVAYLSTPSSHTGSVTSEQPRRHRRVDSDSRPSSGSVHSRGGASMQAAAMGGLNGSMRGEMYLDTSDYRTERRKKKKSRPISGHL